MVINDYNKDLQKKKDSELYYSYSVKFLYFDFDLHLCRNNMKLEVLN